MWRPTNHLPENLERFKERRAEAGIGGVVCHALYLVNLASPKDDIYEKSVTAMCNTVDAGVRDRGRRRRLPRRLAPRRGDGRRGSNGSSTALKKVLERCSDTTWLLMENTAGAGGTIGRSHRGARAVFERLDGHPRLGVCLDSCHLYASGYDVTDEAALDAMLDELDREIGLDRLRALHVNDSKAPLGSNLDRHDNVGEGLMGERLGVFLGHPTLQGLPAVPRGAGARRPRPGRLAGQERRRNSTPAGPPQRSSPNGTTHPAGSGRGPPSGSRLVGKCAHVCDAIAPKVRQRKKRPQALGRTWAKIRKLGSPNGSSWNSGLTHPSSSSRPS